MSDAEIRAFERAEENARLARARLRSGLGWHGETLPERLVADVQHEGEYLWDTGHGFDLRLVAVPKGPVQIGSESGDDERPVWTSTLGIYYVGIVPVTEGQYAAFQNRETENPNLPVVSVSWDEANEFCQRAGLRLPTEEEWERAARWPNSRVYPWSNNWDETRRPTLPVPVLDESGRPTFPQGKASCGAHHMGTIWQWCSDSYCRCRAAYRDWDDPAYRSLYLGFRVALSGASAFEKYKAALEQCLSHDGPSPGPTEEVLTCIAPDCDLPATSRNEKRLCDDHFTLYADAPPNERPLQEALDRIRMRSALKHGGVTGQ